MFALSKLLWLVLDPVNLFTVLFALCVLAAWRARWRIVKTVIAVQTGMLLLLGVMPTGRVLMSALENRIPPATLPAQVDGVLVLGGAVNPWLSARRGQPVLNEAAERVTTFATLARRYPQAKLVVSGGNGMLTEQPPETEATAALLAELGVDRSRLILEGTSRNTHENALNAAALVHPAPSETWVLITSAAHMPRALSVFRRQGWPVLPFPVDYRTADVEGIGFNLLPLQGLMQLSESLHEWLGLLAYWALDRSDALWPAPLMRG